MSLRGDRRQSRQSQRFAAERLPRPYNDRGSLRAPKEIDGFCRGRIEIATVAALLRNDRGSLRAGNDTGIISHIPLGDRGIC